MPPIALVNPIYDCLYQLAQKGLSKEEEVECLLLQLHHIGDQLEKMNRQRMNELLVLIWEGLLFPIGHRSLAQLLPLEVLEF